MLQVGTASKGYIYIQGGVGEGQVHNSYRQYIGIACGSKGKQGKIGILASRAKGV